VVGHESYSNLVLPVDSKAGIPSFQETCKPPNWVWHQSLSFICVTRSCCDRPFTLVGLSATPQALHSDNEVGSAGPRFMDVQLISVKTCNSLLSLWNGRRGLIPCTFTARIGLGTFWWPYEKANNLIGYWHAMGFWMDSWIQRCH